MSETAKTITFLAVAARRAAGRLGEPAGVGRR